MQCDSLLLSFTKLPQKKNENIVFATFEKPLSWEMAWGFGFLAPNICKQLSRNGTFSPGLDVLKQSFPLLMVTVNAYYGQVSNSTHELGLFTYTLED